MAMLMVAANLRLGVGGHPALCLHSSNKPGRCGHKLLLLFFRDFSHTDYLNIYLANLHEICRTDRTLAVDKRSGVIFSIPQETLPWRPILLAKTTSNSLHTL